MMRRLTQWIKTLLLMALPIVAVPVWADPPALPPGHGKYLMVLWPAGTPIPGDPKGTVKNVPEPVLEKFGGKLLSKHDNRRVIVLPLGQAKALRKHEAVVYLQRIWMGESFDDWDETYPQSTSATGRIRPEVDENLQWGPKAYQYDGSGNIKRIGGDEYRYDSAGRLIWAQVSGATITQKTETYGYDSFGNLVQRGVTGANPLTVAVDGGSNRMLGVPYDAAGNVTAADDGRRRYSWDSLNNLSRVHPSIGNDRRVIYDASDERIGTMLVGDSLSRWTIRDLGGQIIREFEGYRHGLGSESWGWYWSSDNFNGGGTLLAGETQAWSYSSEPYGGPRHYHLDHLGSVRMVTNYRTPGRALSEHDYFPFGTTATRTYQEQTDWANNHIDAMRYAGHWRDFLGLLNVDNTEYIDYMHARYYSALEARFLSPDPVIDFKNAIHAPQMWNRYAYVRNNPINATDPDGRCELCLDNSLGREQLAVARGEMTMDQYLEIQRGRNFVGNVGLMMVGVGELSSALRGTYALARAGFSAGEQGVIRSTIAILKSGSKELIKAYESGQAKELVIQGQKIIVQPDAPISGMTLQGEKAFVLGKQAFSSSTELAKTVLHEMYRLTFQQGGAASGASAAAATKAAATFAETAFNVLRVIY